MLPENELRDKVTQDVATKAGQYDVATVGTYEVPIWAKNGWLNDLDQYADDDSALRQERPDPADAQVALGEDGKLYAAPVLRRVLVPDVPQGPACRRQGSTMPEQPTWPQVADVRAPRSTAPSPA